MPQPPTKSRLAFTLVRSLSFAFLVHAATRGLRAEDSISAKFQDYRESGGRIAVKVYGAAVETHLGVATTLKASGIYDAIAGATPDGRPPETPAAQVPLTHIEEVRRAWTFDLGHQFSRLNLVAGVAQSRESDYHSLGGSLNALVDFNQKNTMLLLGLAATDDDVKSPLQVPWEGKRSVDAIAGVTQLLNPLTSLTLNVGFGRTTGYLSDPYKLIQKDTEVIPGFFLPLTFAENRPRSRTKWLALAELNRAFPRMHGALDASVRLHSDDFGTNSQTLQLEWFQNIGAHFMLRPYLRLFRQDAADFYYISLDGTPLVPVRKPTGDGPFYSADYRLSALRTTTYGLKLIWTPSESLHLDVAFERYEMHGRDHITSPTAYPVASIVTAGLQFRF